MMHYHITQRINGGEPFMVLTDRHADCAGNAFRGIRVQTVMQGYCETENESGPMSEWSIFTRDYLDSENLRVESSVVAFTLYACTCFEGEILLSVHRPVQATLN